MNVLAIDQGTTNTKAVLISPQGQVLARATAALTTQYPHPGWAEQSAEAIWASVQSVIAQIVATHLPIQALAIANQRETLVVWDAKSNAPLGPAVLWQCRRTSDDCAALIFAGHGPAVLQATGLGINPLFPASKLAWVLRKDPQAKALAAKGQLRAGTVDAWLLWNLTGGRSFATDHSNASRTQLFDTATRYFSPDLCDIFGVPPGVLPEPRASDAGFGETATAVCALPAGVPILAMMGDSHAALYGHGIRKPGSVKATYGTGSSLMVLTPARVLSANGLSGTIAWSTQSGTAYALEGNITVSAQAAAFMAGLLGLPNAAALSDLAQSVAGSEGVVFVPAMAGLGAPHWDDRASGTITGMTHGTTQAHLAYATFEAIAHQIADVFDAMQRDVGQPLSGLRADGGASSNRFLMQMQADLLGRSVQTAQVEEIGALGVAAMAFAATGHAMPLPEPSARFEPLIAPERRQSFRDQWTLGLGRARR